MDPRWSAWSGDAYRDYTNLHEGSYRFRVRARNVYGERDDEATFAFRILPPWYRTPRAWLVWIVLAAVAAGLLLYWRGAALHRRNRRLSALVEQRTTELQAANVALAEQSVTDPLTGLRNRRYVHAHFADGAPPVPPREHKRRQAPDHSHAMVLMIDLDHFKQVNDAHGHAAGDQVLRQFAAILRAATRDGDVVARWGGEEFLIVTRRGSEAAGSRLAERIRRMVAQHAFVLDTGTRLGCTCSLGFAIWPLPGDAGVGPHWEQAVNAADECLYAAKRNGRNAWVGVTLAHWPDGVDPLAAGAEDDDWLQLFASHATAPVDA